MNRREKIIQDALIEATKKKTAEMAVTIYNAALILTLRKEFGFGEQRLLRVLQGIEKESTPVFTGMIGWEDYRNYVEELTGVNIIRPELEDYSDES